MNTKRFEFEIVRGDAFDLAFADYFFGNDEKKSKVRAMFAKRSFRTKQNEITYRVMSHWGKEGLLPDKRNGIEWRKFTIVEIVWLTAVRRMREFGISIDCIKRVKSDIFFFNDEMKCYPLFEFYVASAWLSKEDACIVVSANGGANISTHDQLQASQMFFGTRDFLLISIKQILETIGLTVRQAESLYSLSDEELSLLAALRLENNDEIKVKLQNKSVDIIERTRKVYNPDAAYKAHSVMASNKGYGEVVNKYVDGKIFSQSITMSEKLNKDKPSKKSRQLQK